FLRKALGQYLQIEAGEVRFRITAEGKPELLGNYDVRFNLSHSEGVAVLAVTRNRLVGIDVERIRQDVEEFELADRFFAASESEWFRSHPASEHIPAFFTCWTAKEAYLKARGEGLTLPLDSFSIIPSPDSQALQLKVFNNPEEAKRWSLWRLDL